MSKDAMKERIRLYKLYATERNKKKTQYNYKNNNKAYK